MNYLNKLFVILLNAHEFFIKSFVHYEINIRLNVMNKYVFMRLPSESKMDKNG